MAKITYVEPGGVERVVEGHVGEAAMEAAVRIGVEGIDADCGGACACATCHGYIDAAFMTIVPPMKENESEMLEVVEDARRPNSRLLCQIPITEQLDGLVIHVAGRAR